MDWKRWRPSPALAVALAALVIGASGGAWAATSGSGSITACVQRHGGGLYVAHTCKRHDRRLSWNVVGRNGVPGPPGPPGPDTGAAGGDLTGSYPNPQIAPGAIGTSKIASLPGAAVYANTSPQNIPSATLTPISLPTTEWDNGGMSDPANSQLVVRTPGTYLLEATVRIDYASSASQTIEAFITQNGGAVAEAIKAAAGVQDTLNVSGIVRLAAGDAIGLAVSQSTGSAAASISSAGKLHAPLTPVLQAEWLGP